MSDPTPPPDEPIPPQARARIRAELLGAARAETRPAARAGRWLVPVAIAAAVLLVAGIAAWVVRLDGDGTASGPAGGVATSRPPATTAPSASPTDRPNLRASEAPTTSTHDPAPANVARPDCAEQVDSVLPGARRVAAFPGRGGNWVTSYWVAGQRFVLCDVRAGTTTVHHALPLTPREDVATYRVSSVYPAWPNASAVIRVAGGIVPEGATAFDVTYTFPNGGTQHAETITDDQGRTWWRMLYVYDDGGGNELDKPPIRVTVSYSGVQQSYELRWGLDTCAQANHGC